MTDLISNIIPADKMTAFSELPEKARNRFHSFINYPNQTLLDLSDCHLQTDDMVLIADFLNLIPRITTLNIGFNTIGNEGARALAENQTITTLDVDHNKFSDEGARALAKNNTITELYLSSGYHSKEVFDLIEEMPKRNRKNLEEFKNAISLIGQGKRNIGEGGINVFRHMPNEWINGVINALAKSHGFFVRTLEKDINRNLMAKDKPSTSSEMVTDINIDDGNHIQIESLEPQVQKRPGTDIDYLGGALAINK